MTNDKTNSNEDKQENLIKAAINAANFIYREYTDINSDGDMVFMNSKSRQVWTELINAIVAIPNALKG